MARKIKERKLKTNRYFATSEDVISVLRRYIINFSKQQTFLSNERWVSMMLEDNKLTKAIENAESISMDGESYSNLYKLFRLIPS